MDYLDWECSPIITNVSSSWSNQEHEVADQAFTESDSNGCVYNGEIFDLPGHIFNPIEQLHKTNIAGPPITQSHHLQYYSNPDKLFSQMVQHLAPPLDSVIVASSPNFSQSQEAAISLPQRDEVCSLKRPYSVAMDNTLSGQMTNFSMPTLSYEENNGFKAAISTNTASLESLDCLLSATNSNTDTSVEDDGIYNSIMDNSCKSLWPKVPAEVTNKSNYAAAETYQKFDGNANYRKSYGGFSLVSTNPQPQSKKRRMLEKLPSSSNISFQQPNNNSSLTSTNFIVEEPDAEAIAQMKEMIYRAAAFRPVNFGEEVVEKPKRKNVKISSDPQTVAARQRRERISEKIRVLQRLVPGGSKMDTASMLDEAANYLKFLRSQVTALENVGPKLDFMNSPNPNNPLLPFPMQTTTGFTIQNPNPTQLPKT